jgi:type III restriction enzyme
VDHTKELREHLERDLGLPAAEIKICTSKLDELKDVKDISSASCPVRFIITVQKLREGWDCPFAYVLCSLQNSASATAIEQIVGRVLRLPSAAFKRNAPLNEAYVFSVSPSLPPVLAELRGALEMNGFTPAEADQIILPAGGDLTLAEQPRTFHVDPANDFNPEQLAENSPALLGKVAIDAAAGRVTVLKPINEEDERALLDCLRTEPAREAARGAIREIRETAAAFQIQPAPAVPKAPFDQGVPFRVPVLGLMEGDLFERFEDTHLLEHEWDLSEKDASLTEAEFPSKRQTGEIGQVDVRASGDIETGKAQEMPGENAASTDFVASLHKQVWSFAETSEWPEEKLIQWIDAKIFRSASERREIPAEQSALFIRKVLSGLKSSRGMGAAALMLDRHRLVSAIEAKIRRHRERERTTAWQGFLLDDSPLVAPEPHAIDFSTIHYDPSWNYDGAFQFQKHYFAPGPGELKSSGEEYQCACFLDGLAEVKTWVRNLSRRQTAFSLQIPKQRFYPDFVCLLHDGRVLVVEYKGKPWYQIEQSAEKRAVGAVWESRSGGRGLFIMPDGPDLQAIRSKLQT